MLSPSKHRSAWELYASSYDRILPALPFYREMLDRHTDLILSTGASNVLDVGGGTGNLAVRLADNSVKVTVVEPCSGMVSRLREKLEGRRLDLITVLVQSAERLEGLSDGCFQTVNASLALFAVQNPKSALEEMIRVLAPGGMLLVTEPRMRFDVDLLLSFAERYLTEQNLLPELKRDWESVCTANHVIDPAGREARIPAETLVAHLLQSGFTIRACIDSHLQQCATISAVKTAHV